MTKRFSLMMALLMVTGISMAQTFVPIRFAAKPVHSTDANTFLVGFETISGVSTDYKYSIADLAAYIGSSGPNFASADLTLTADRLHNGANHNINFSNFLSWRVDAPIQLYKLTLGSGIYTVADSVGNVLLKAWLNGGRDSVMVGGPLVSTNKFSGLALNSGTYTLQTGRVLMTANNTAGVANWWLSYGGAQHLLCDSASKKVLIGATGDTVEVSNAYKLAGVDGTNGQAQETDGAGHLHWVNVDPTVSAFTINGDAANNNFDVGVTATSLWSAFYTTGTAVTYTGGLLNPLIAWINGSGHIIIHVETNSGLVLQIGERVVVQCAYK